MIPENNLQHLTPHQARVQKSFERINVPSWYKQGESKNGEIPRWRRGESSKPGWRRSGSGKTFTDRSRPTTPGNVTLSSQESSPCPTPFPLYKSSYTRWSTNQLNHIPGRESYFTAPSPSHSSYSIKSLNSSSSLSTSYKQPYLGWRSQERLAGSGLGSCISTPAQRLATSTIRARHLSSSQARVTPSEPVRSIRKKEEKKDNTELHDSIKEVTDAIDNYCNINATPSATAATTTMKKHKNNKRRLSSKGTFEGLLDNCSLVPARTGRRVWLESSFLPTKPSGERGQLSINRLGGDQVDDLDLGLRLEDQIF